MTRCPWAAARAIVPAVSSDSSSGWAWKARRVCDIRSHPVSCDAGFCELQSALRPGDCSHFCGHSFSSGRRVPLVCEHSGGFVLMKIRAILFCLTICALSALPAIAQDNVRLVVSVTSGDGAPVRDLKKTDFTVQDAGKPRTIDNFVAPAAMPAAPPQQGAGQFTNAPDVTHSGAIFVVLDTIHTRYLDERDVRGMILKFMARAAESKHAVTLAILSDKGLSVYHDYRSGPDVLLAALIKAGLGGMKRVAPPPGANDALVTADATRLTAFSKGDLSNATPQEQLVRSNPQMPMTMFQDVGHAAYGLPGRKALVWVTNAVPFDIDPKTFNFVSPKDTNRGVDVNGVAAGGSKDVLSADQVKKILPVWRASMRALFDGGVAVYPVEARNSFTAASDALMQGRMKLLADRKSTRLNSS